MTIEVNNIDVVKILLEKGAYPLMMNGTIPLELAMNEGHYEIADLFEIIMTIVKMSPICKPRAPGAAGHEVDDAFPTVA